MIKFFTTWFFKNSYSQRPGGSKDNKSYQFCKMSSKEVGKKCDYLRGMIFLSWKRDKWKPYLNSEEFWNYIKYSMEAVNIAGSSP